MMKSFIVIGLVISQSVLAWDWGNGGDVVVCRDVSGKIASAELYDFFEAEHFGMGRTSFEGADLDARVLFLAKRLHAVVPSLSLEKESLKVLSRIQFFLDGFLEDEVELDRSVLPEDGCNIEQAAKVVLGHPFFEKDFLVSKEIWDALSDLDKAGLSFHLVLMRYQALNGVKGWGQTFRPVHSSSTRWITGALTRNNSGTDEGWLRSLQGIGLAAVEYKGSIFTLNREQQGLLFVPKMTFYDSGALRSAAVAEVLIQGKRRKIDLVNGIPIDTVFYENGHVSEAKLSGHFSNDLKFRFGTETIELDGKTKLELFPDENLKAFAIREIYNKTFEYLHLRLYCSIRRNVRVEAYQNGNFKSLRCYSSSLSWDQNGISGTAQEVQFYESGHIQSIQMDSQNRSLLIYHSKGNILVRGGQFEFYEDEAPKRGLSSGGFDFSSDVGKGSVIGEIEFYPNYRIKHAVLATDSTLTTEFGESFTFLKGTEVWLNANGKVTDFD